MWVKVPQIDGSSGTDHIWLYYGNAAAPDAQNVAAVWNSGYVAVYHLDDTLQDSTANLNHGTNSGSLDAPGRVADGQWFDGVDDYVDLGSAATVDNLFAGGGTVSAWIRPTGWGEGSYGRILDKTIDHFADGGWGFELYGANQSLRFEQGYTGAARGAWYTPSGSTQLARGNTSSWSITTVLSPTIQSCTSTAACKRSPKRLRRAASPTRMPRQVCGWAISRPRYDTRLPGRHGRSASGTRHAFRRLVDAEYASMTDSLITFGQAGVLLNDVDPDGDTLSTTLVSGPSHAAAFSLRYDGSFTYTHDGSETSGDSFTYQVSDGKGSTGVATVSITINPVNDNSPVFSSSATALLDENTTSVVTLQATDADLPGQTVTFAVTGGVDSARFHIVSGNRLEFVVGPDYEAPSDSNSDNVYEIQVTADDGYGLSTVQALVVTVIDVNESGIGPISDADAAPDFVLENAAMGTNVGVTAWAADPDGTDTVSYTLDDNAGGRFAIDAATGVVTVAGAIDRELAASYDITVRAASSDGTFTTQTFTIALGDVDD